LAEFVVIMVAGNKGRADMAVEMKPFFRDQEQADAFVDWVEECKWKFLTGGPSPQQVQKGTSQQKITAATGQVQSVGAAQTPSSAAQSSPQHGPPVVPPIDPATAGTPRSAPTRARLTPNSENQPTSLRNPTFVRPGPHVAITNRVVLQPNPDFRESSLVPGVMNDRPPVWPASSPPQLFPAQTRSTVFSKAASKAVAKSIGNPKYELLENGTKQLQLILTKLSDRGLGDETREKYQTLAQNIQAQMAKISSPKYDDSWRSSRFRAV